MYNYRALCDLDFATTTMLSCALTNDTKCYGTKNSVLDKDVNEEPFK